MFTAISRFFSSITRLASSLDALADTASATNLRLRERLQLDHDDAARPQLTDAATPADDPFRDQADATDGHKRNGRKAKQSV